MNKWTVGIAGVLTPLFFVIGFVVLFILNPQAYEELNNLSLAAYNIVGMDTRWLSVIIYSTVGILNVVVCVGLFLNVRNKSEIVIGKVSLLICGMIWFSFAVFPYDPMTDNFSNHLLLVRVIGFIITSIFGLIFLGVDFGEISKDKFLKRYTILSGFLILVLGTLSTFVYNDATWIRTNASFTIYFVWFGVFGIRMLAQLKPDLKTDVEVPSEQ